MDRPVPLKYVVAGDGADRLAAVYRALLQKKKGPTLGKESDPLSPALEDSNVTLKYTTR